MGKLKIIKITRLLVSILFIGCILCSIQSAKTYGEELTQGPEYEELREYMPVITDIKEMNYHTVKITWNEWRYASEYFVYRSESENGAYKQIALLDITKRSYTDKTVKPGKTYYYQICSVNLSSPAEYAYSKKVPVYIKGTPNRPAIRVKKTKKKLQIKWGIIKDNSIGIDIYIKEGKKKYKCVSEILDLKKSKKKKGVTGLSAPITNFKKGVKYKVKVRTYSRVNKKLVYSKWSKEKSFKRKK